VPSVTWSEGGTSYTTSYAINSAGVTSNDAPVVIFLHGADGNRHHFSAPGVSPGFNHDMTWTPPTTWDAGWREWMPSPVKVYLGDPLKTVEGVEPFIARNGYRTVNYSQMEPTGLLKLPVLEFDAVFRHVRAQFPASTIHIVCHSRGGLLVRRWLADARLMGRTADLAKIRTVQTLDSPHRGSALADIMRFIDVAMIALPFLYPFFLPLALLVRTQTGKPCMQEVGIVGNVFLAQLEQDELRLSSSGNPHPGIALHAFNGTEPRLQRVHRFTPDAMSYVPQLRSPAFHWQLAYDRRFHALPDTVAGVLPDEARPGMGDILVAVANTTPRTWMPTSRPSFPVNHSSVLWDQRVKDRVLANLGGPLNLVQAGLSISAPAVAPNSPATVTAVVVNRGQRAWAPGEVTTVVTEGAGLAPWSGAVGALASGSTTTLAPSFTSGPAGSYGVSAEVRHATGSVLAQASTRLTVNATCLSLRAEIAALEAELVELASVVEGPRSAGFRRALNLKSQIAALQRRSRELGC
jgi:hypothetical protein